MKLIKDLFIGMAGFLSVVLWIAATFILPVLIFGGLYKLIWG